MWEFKDPLLLLLWPLIMTLMYFFCFKNKPASIKFPSLDLVKGLSSSWKVQFKFLPAILRVLAITLFVVALAGPRSVLEETVVTTEGVDIVLAIDASTSMKAEDFTIENQRRNRLFVVKSVIADFIEHRKNDRIGLVAFAGRAYTVAPLTTDHDWLNKNLERIDFGLIEDGTAIGSSIAAAVSRLKETESKSKIIILLTDGANNAGKIDPLTAARTAQALGIKIYAIGAGTKGLAPYPVTDFFGRQRYRQVQIDIDENLLKEIADITGGRYFRATDTSSLRDIYSDIDQLEKTEIEEKGFREYEELYGWFLGLALLFLFVELILDNTIFLKVP